MHLSLQFVNEIPDFSVINWACENVQEWMQSKQQWAGYSKIILIFFFRRHHIRGNLIVHLR